jgi:hypothetical protein
MNYKEAKVAQEEIKAANERQTACFNKAVNDLLEIPELKWPAPLCETFLDLLLDSREVIKEIDVSVHGELKDSSYQSFLVQHSKAVVEMMVAGTNAIHRPLLDTLHHLVKAPRHYHQSRVLNKQQGRAIDSDDTAASVIQSHLEYLEFFIALSYRQFQNRIEQINQSLRHSETDGRKNTPGSGS